MELKAQAPALRERGILPRAARRDLLLGWDVLWCILALVPIAIVTVTVFRHSADIVRSEDWTYVQLVAKSYSRDFSFRDLWFQHTEHRPIFPWLVLIPLVRWTRWNMAWVHTLVLAVAALLVSFFVSRVGRDRASLPAPCSRWDIPLLSAIVFSLTATGVWLTCWGLAPYLSAAAAVAALFLLTAEPWRWGRFAASVVAAVIATFSCTNGLVLWPVAWLVLLVRSSLNGSARVAALAFWAAAGLAAYALYAVDFRIEYDHMRPTLAFEYPSRFLEFVLAYLGRPASPTLKSAFGFLGLAWFSVLVLWLWQLRSVRRDILLPYVAVGMYSVACACLTALSRLWRGLAQAAASHYVAHSNLLWMAVAALSYMLYQARTRPADQEGPPRIFSSAGAFASVMTACFIAIAFPLASLRMIPTYRSLWESQVHMRERILALEGRVDREIVQMAGAAGYVMPAAAASLKKHGLSVFRAPNALLKPLNPQAEEDDKYGREYS